MSRLPFLSNTNRRALLFLEWLLLIGLVGYGLFTWRQPEKAGTSHEATRQTSSAEESRYTYAVEEEPVETFPFDPNTADSTTLLRLGLAPWQVRAVYRYRAKHGRYHTPEDFMRLPGMTVELWQRLGPQVRIAEAFRYVTPPARAKQDAPALPHEAVAAGPDSLRGIAHESQREVRRDSFPRQEKLAAGITVDINTADTAALKMIPGIGSRRAASIVAYRQKLGGFVTAEQAMEAIEMPDSVLQWMRVEQKPVGRINLNKASVQKMMNHPYLSFYQAKAINEYRRNKGELHGLDDLSKMKEFQPTDIERLEPYVSF